MKQVEMKYQEMNIWKVNEFNFLKMKKLRNLQAGGVKFENPLRIP